MANEPCPKEIQVGARAEWVRCEAVGEHDRHQVDLHSPRNLWLGTVWWISE